MVDGQIISQQVMCPVLGAKFELVKRCRGLSQQVLLEVIS